jgi:outer membrane lipoprotein
LNETGVTMRHSKRSPLSLTPVNGNNCSTKTAPGRHASFAIGRALPALATLVLAACSTVPEGLRGEYPPITPQQTTVKHIGTSVRWGGVILDARPSQRQTCFEILSRELGSSARPRVQDVTQGRFVACTGGFQDPEVFTRGREMTLTGRIQGIEQRKVGEFDYRLPRVAAEFVTMWPIRPDVVQHDFNGPGWGPYWGPGWWGPGWGPYWGPHWGGAGFWGSGRSRIYPGDASRERVEIVPAEPVEDSDD